MSYVEKEKLIRSDILSIENRVRHAFNQGYDLGYKEGLQKNIKRLSSVTPQPKTGHWIDIMVGDMPAQVCDRCNTFFPLAYTGGGHHHCPNCGARMIEPQESEDEV